jgi:hypothetical protein
MTQAQEILIESTALSGELGRMLLAFGIVIVILAAGAILQELGLRISRAVAWLAAVAIAGAGLVLVALSGFGIIW